MTVTPLLLTSMSFFGLLSSEIPWDPKAALYEFFFDDLNGAVALYLGICLFQSPAHLLGSFMKKNSNLN